MMRFFPLLLSPLLLFITAAHAGIYKWTDAAGKIHYSDKPPENSNKLQELEIEDLPEVTNVGESGLRAGELRMLKTIERRRKRAAEARRKRARQEAKESRRQALEEAKMEEKCAALEGRIDKIHGRLRQSHSAAQGAKLHKSRREIADKIHRYCK